MLVAATVIDVIDLLGLLDRWALWLRCVLYVAVGVLASELAHMWCKHTEKKREDPS